MPVAFKMLETPIPDTVKKLPPVSPDTIELSPSPETFKELPIFKFGRLLIVVEVATPFTVEVSTPLFNDKLLELIIEVVPTEPATLETNVLVAELSILFKDKLETDKLSTESFEAVAFSRVALVAKRLVVLVVEALVVDAFRFVKLPTTPHKFCIFADKLDSKLVTLRSRLVVVLNVPYTELV